MTIMIKLKAFSLGAVAPLKRTRTKRWHMVHDNAFTLKFSHFILRLRCLPTIKTIFKIDRIMVFAVRFGCEENRNF